MKRFSVSHISKVSKTIRFPNALIQQVEEKIRTTDCSFSRFVIAAVEFSLEQMEDQTDENDRSE